MVDVFVFIVELDIEFEVLKKGKKGKKNKGFVFSSWDEELIFVLEDMFLEVLLDLLNVIKEFILNILVNFEFEFEVFKKKKKGKKGKIVLIFDDWVDEIFD